jgi:hypothetical protein
LHAGPVAPSRESGGERVRIRAIVVAAAFCLPAYAEIAGYQGLVRVVVRQYESGQVVAADEQVASYPEPQVQLPLQVVVRAGGQQEDAAGSVAAQFADPLELGRPNPEEFAVNLALVTAQASSYFAGLATTQERRDVLLTPADVPGTVSGQRVRLAGRVYLDGALAILAVTPEADLSTASVELRVSVVRSAEGEADQTVFSGSLELVGGPDGSVQQIAEGDFPVDRVIRSDLSPFVEEFELFEVLILPRLVLRYSYEAVIDRPFVLTATLEVAAVNAPQQVGVVAVLGTPVDSIRQVISAVQGEKAANAALAALAAERARPTGRRAFAESRPAAPICGLLGVESTLGLLTLAVLQPRRRRVH